MWLCTERVRGAQGSSAFETGTHPASALTRDLLSQPTLHLGIFLRRRANGAGEIPPRVVMVTKQYVHALEIYILYKIVYVCVHASVCA